MTQQKKPQVRAAILDAAFKLFSIKGCAATSIGEIGRLRLVLRSLWRDLPFEQHCFANNLMQAASSVRH